MKVNKRAIRLWVKALRSGEFEQAKKCLAKKNVDGPGYSYCCLGVSCEVAKKAGVRGVPSRKEMIRMGFLPNSVQKFLGVEDDNPKITKNFTATTVNDIKSWSFKRIASALERRYLSPAK